VTHAGGEPAGVDARRQPVLPRKVVRFAEVLPMLVEPAR